MPIKRLIPLIQLDEEGQAVKTHSFQNRTYVGDPLNLIKLFNELEVDEVGIWDIDKTKLGKPLNIHLLEEMAFHARMPLSYGGGLSTMSEVNTVVSLGFEKISFSLSSWMKSELPEVAASELGSSGVTAVINFKKNLLRQFSGFDHRTVKPLMKLAEAIDFVTQKGAGEVLLQSMKNDGSRRGMEIEAISLIDDTVKVPIVLAGGAKNHAEAIEVLRHKGVDAIASGSCFTFVTSRSGVLPSYPSDEERFNDTKAPQ
jgi:imidazole glycerol-phosphate synthase subunit HisF